jgi:hypothetical protein
MKMRWVGHIARMHILIGKAEEKRPFQRLGIDTPIIIMKRNSTEYF